MFSTPNVIGQIVTRAGARVYRNSKRDNVQPGGPKVPPSWRKVPTGFWKKEAARPSNVETSPVLYNLRSAHKYADELYQRMSPADRAVWKAAIKKKKMSAYDLWMKECMTLLLEGRSPPDTPSISGGWSVGKVIEGTTFPPFVAAPMPWLSRAYIEHLGEAGPPPWTELWNLHLDWEVPFDFPEPWTIELHTRYKWIFATEEWQQQTLLTPLDTDHHYKWAPGMHRGMLLTLYDPTTDPPTAYSGALDEAHPWLYCRPTQAPWTPPPPYELPVWLH